MGRIKAVAVGLLVAVGVALLLFAVEPSSHPSLAGTDTGIGITMQDGSSMEIDCSGDTLTFTTVDVASGSFDCEQVGPVTTTTVPVVTTTSVPDTTTTLPGSQPLTTVPCVVELQALELGVCTGGFQTEVGLG